MTRVLLALAILCLVGPAVAQTIFPARYDVTGVAADDVLNLRAGPGASHEIVGSLAPGRTNVEIVGTDPDGSWGMVALPEGTAWASLRFLTRQPGQDDWSPLAQLPLRCIGTEPFWSVAFPSEGYLEFSEPGGPNTGIDLNNFATSANDLRHSSFEGSSEGGPVVGVLRRAECSDGMSDRVYGIQLDYFPQVLGGIRHLTGCCRLD